MWQVSQPITGCLHLDRATTDAKGGLHPKEIRTGASIRSTANISSNATDESQQHRSSPWKAPQHRKSFFDSGDFFPEPKQSVSIYGEIENRLKMRGIDEPSKDLETLKQILEALQLKGLLHSKKPSEQNPISHRNFVYDESPIVVMKPSRVSTPAPISRRRGNSYSPSNGRNQILGGGGSKT
ncbi:hypothetical protein DH2020_006232 [Rehmannia glutinosa]|uniref:Uncharacterized protein n=1 Tax=Rehmannia glutinosa TaxID=99300 RepID=A0ABR0XIP1_REHGL